MKKGFLFVFSILFVLNLWAQQLYPFVLDSRTKHELLMDMRVLVESGQAARQTVGSFVLKSLPVVHLDAGASTILEYTVSGSFKS